MKEHRDQQVAMGDGCQGGCRSFHLSDRSGELTLAGRGQEERIVVRGKHFQLELRMLWGMHVEM